MNDKLTLTHPPLIVILLVVLPLFILGKLIAGIQPVTAGKIAVIAVLAIVVSFQAVAIFTKRVVFRSDRVRSRAWFTTTEVPLPQMVAVLPVDSKVFWLLDVVNRDLVLEIPRFRIGTGDIKAVEEFFRRRGRLVELPPEEVDWLSGKSAALGKGSEKSTGRYAVVVDDNFSLHG